MASEGIRTDRAGAGFKPQHLTAIIESRADAGFFEVHAENYMGAGGPPHARLERLREDYPLSVHGVGLSIGGAGPLDEDHLSRLKTVVERYEPALVSEHLAWSTHQAGYMNDLLALPYNAETLMGVTDHVDRVQDVLGRRILLENPSSYVTFENSTFDEVDFIRETQRRTGCGLLLDVNNVVVSCFNHGWDADDYIARFPLRHVEEIHLAGHDVRHDENGGALLIDTHDRAVADPVIELFRDVIRRTGAVPSLIEWDADVPDWAEMMIEVEKISLALGAESYRGVMNDVA